MQKWAGDHYSGNSTHQQAAEQANRPISFDDWSGTAVGMVHAASSAS